MHRKHIRRWPKIISFASALAVLFGGLVVQSVQAVSSNPTPVCVGSTCTVTFNYSGDYYLWSPPTGAKNLTFDLAGAQGGRSGGQGGRVTGSLTSVPTALYIYVGGSGLQGSGVAGGFNGGGTAGSGRGDEGSGGGATDIRTTTALTDRVAIAAGGGGSGGYSGGIGGSGGGLIGNSGTSGQGQGGAGATASGGGSGGYPNGGSWGSNGTSGQGGSGGTSSVSGGGGGGGGYFGGGGGGADVDTCCSNAGGGGGGSSFAHSTLTASATHTTGYRAGAGVAIISYSIPPTVVNFASATALTNAESLTYSLSFSEPVTGLSGSDFAPTGTATCSQLTVAGAGADYTVTASSCTVGSYTLALNAATVSGALPGPPSAVTADQVVIERTKALAEFTAPTSPTNAQTHTYNLAFSETVTGLNTDDLEVSGQGCVVDAITGEATSWAVTVTGCLDGQTVALSIKADAVADAAGNLGPELAVVAAPVEVNRSAPLANWTAGVAETHSQPEFELSLEGPVTGLELADFENLDPASTCLLTLTKATVGEVYAITATDCSFGDIQLKLRAGSYQDELGNLGPAVDLASNTVKFSAVPVAVPAPVAAPATPDTQPEPAPTQQPPAPFGSDSESQTEYQSQSEPEDVPPVSSGGGAGPNTYEWVDDLVASSLVADDPNSGLVELEEIATPAGSAGTASKPNQNLADDSESPAGQGFWLDAAIGWMLAILGTLLAILVGVTVFRSARNLRQRQMTRLFI